MSLDVDSRGAWDALGGPWRRCFELAWEAYAAESVPVGAVITNETGIVGEGRSRMYGEPSVPGALAGTLLSHAEVNALAGLSLGSHYEDHFLYTSLEPCLLCVGAAAMATVGTIRYAGTDPYGGAAQFVGRGGNAHLERFDFAVEGPLEGPFGTLGAALLVEFYIRRASGRHVRRAFAETAPEIVTVAERLRDRRIARRASAGASLPEVLSDIWDLVAG